MDRSNGPTGNWSLSSGSGNPNSNVGKIEDETFDNVIEEESGPDPTHTCTHCEREKRIESEPRSSYSWCAGAGSVTEWVPLDSPRS